jgi:hypothetical protein
MERGVLGDGGVGAVDPRTADLEVRLAGAGECFDRSVDHCRVEVGACGITATGCVDRPVRITKTLTTEGASDADQQPAVKWLTAAELDSWLSVVRLMIWLPWSIDQQLQRLEPEDGGVPGFGHVV